MDDSETCPNCKTSKYNKPSMRLMINTCAHVLCESCVEQLFYRGSGPCPRCGMVLKKNDFRDRVFEDTYIEKDIQIRKKYLKELIRQENEFPSLREYNDHLESVETIIFNLTNSIDEEETFKKIEELKKEAKEGAKNRNRIMLDIKKENPTYTYREFEIVNHGPILPSTMDVLSRYAQSVNIDASQFASGFPPHVPARRLITDSFMDLYLNVR